jgi:hypothetical protein
MHPQCTPHHPPSPHHLPCTAPTTSPGVPVAEAGTAGQGVPESGGGEAATTTAHRRPSDRPKSDFGI